MITSRGLLREVGRLAPGERIGRTVALARELEAPITGALDVAVPGQMEAVFDEIRTKWGRLDSLVHSIAFAPL